MHSSLDRFAAREKQLKNVFLAARFKRFFRGQNIREPADTNDGRRRNQTEFPRRKIHVRNASARNGRASFDNRRKQSNGNKFFPERFLFAVLWRTSEPTDRQEPVPGVVDVTVSVGAQLLTVRTFSRVRHSYRRPGTSRTRCLQWIYANAKVLKACAPTRSRDTTFRGERFEKYIATRFRITTENGLQCTFYARKCSRVVSRSKRIFSGRSGALRFLKKKNRETLRISFRRYAMHADRNIFSNVPPGFRVETEITSSNRS